MAGHTGLEGLAGQWQGTQVWKVWQASGRAHRFGRFGGPVATVAGNTTVVTAAWQARGHCRFGRSVRPTAKIGGMACRLEGQAGEP